MNEFHSIAAPNYPKIWEADCNEVETELEAVAQEVGWLVEYPALYPHFISEGRTIYLPG